MTEEAKDVQVATPTAEDTAAAPSAETNDNPAPSTEDVTNTQEEQKVPLDRFQEVNDQKKYYQELYEQATANAQQTPDIRYQGNTDMDEATQMKQFQEFTSKTAEAAVERRLNLERAKSELESISKKEDFGRVAADMNRILKDKPTYSVTDAYELAKVRSGVFEDQVRGKIAQDEKQREAEAAKANAEEPGISPQADPTGRVEAAFERDAKGNFKYTAEELRDMLKSK